MQGRSVRLVPAVVCQLLVWSALASAEGPPPAPLVEEVQPSVIHLRDKSGNLVPVPGFRLEDFQQMLRREYELKQGAQPPRFTLQAMTASGTAKADHAQLTIQFQYLVHEEGWVRIPLRLDQAVLRAEIQYKGPGQQFVHFEPDGGGYVCWARGGAGRARHLTMDVLVPLVVVGEETRLKLSAPRATTSEVKLTVPLSGALGRVTEGASLQSAPSADGTQTLFTVLGLGGDSELAWRKSTSRQADPQTVLEASGSILARVGGQGIDCELKLSVRGLGAPFDSFRVRLPKGAELVPGSPSGYSLAAVGSGGPGDGERKTCEVRLAKKSSGPVEVQLNTRVSYQSAGMAGWCELAGYEVVGASRHSGHVALVAGPPWQVLFGPFQRVRQVDEPPEPLRRKDLLAAFEYYGQPCSLSVRVVEAKSRVSVEPEYRLLVDADRVTLKGKLRYRIRAAAIGALDVDLPGWELEDGGPDNLIAFDGVIGRSGSVSLPLLQRPMGPVEVTIRATRKIAGDVKTLLLELPRPRGDLRAPATVAVLPADNVELTPTPKDMVGLAAQQAAPSMDLSAERADRQQEPRYYRAEPDKAVFAALFRVQPQKIGVSVTTQVTLDEQKAQVRETLAYTVAYKRQDQWTLEIPRSLAGPTQIEVFVDNKPQVPVDLPDPGRQTNAADPVRKQLRLAPGCLGSCEVVIQYSVDLKDLRPNTSIAATIPLVMPVEGELTGNKVLVAAQEGLRVQTLAGRWTPGESPPPQDAQRRALRWSAAERTAELPLGLYLAEHSTLGSTVVHQAWVQTWLTGTLRQDRAVFRITGDQKTVELILPAGVSFRDVRLWLDGKPSVAQATRDGRLIVTLAGDATQGRRQLELVYQFSGTRPAPGSMSLELPRLARGVLAYRTYWQLILPRHEHLLAPPADLTPEYRWDWQGLLWGRQSVLDQPHLETWSGGRHLSDLAAQTNRYLFSTLGSVEKCALRTVTRATLVLAASGLMLVAGLVWIYVPVVRHPVVLLLAAVLLGFAAITYPEPALLASQAASAGVVLAIFAGWLRRSVAGRGRGVLAGQLAGSSFDKASTQPAFPLPPVSDETATETEQAESSMPISGPRP